MEVPPGGAQPAAARVWETLDEPWRQAFHQAWAALRTGNIPVGACAATPDGRISYERAVRALGEGATVDLAYELARGGEVSLLTAMEPDAAFGYLWPRLHQLVNSPPTF